MNVYQKLISARLKLQNTELKKSGNNKFAGYKYFELEIFKTNRTIFDQLQVESKELHTELMEKFKTAKERLK